MKKIINLDNIKRMIFIFFIGCIIGWVYEMIFYYVTEGIIENRGFLYGPYLPVYGVGSVLMYIMLSKLKKHPILLFLLAMIITGVVEYITGIWMWNSYHRRWWDYTGLFLNIDGHVCLRSVVSFAIGGELLIYVVIPLIEKILDKWNKKLTSILSILFILIIVVDYILTFIYRY